MAQEPHDQKPARINTTRHNVDEIERGAQRSPGNPRQSDTTKGHNSRARFSPSGPWTAESAWTEEDRRAGRHTSTASIEQQTEDKRPEEQKIATPSTSYMRDIMESIRSHSMESAKRPAFMEKPKGSDEKDDAELPLSTKVMIDMAYDLQKKLAIDPTDTEPKDYWSSEGPVRREHFEEFVKTKENSEIVMKGLVLDMASQRNAAYKEAEKLREALAVAYAMIEALERKGYRLGANVRHEITSTTRNIPREKVYDPALLGTPHASENQAAAGQFLYDNLQDQQNELMAEVLLQRAKAASILERWGEVLEKSMRAGDLADSLGYKPLKDRARFYQGLAHYAREEWREAVELLTLAKGCKGKYQEGELVQKWLDLARSEVKEPPKK